MYSSIIIISLVVIAAEAFSRGRYNNRNVEMRSNFIQSRNQFDNCEFGICEHAEKYPTAKISKLLENYKTFDSFFGKIIEPYQDRKITNRFADVGSGLCEVQTVSKRPTYLRDVHGNDRIIVNVNNATQIVLFEVCTRPDHECSNNGILRTYRCTQKYTAIGLLALKNEENFEVARFQIPTTCVCALSDS